MKKIFFEFILVFVLLLTTAQVNYAQFIIRFKPIAPRAARIVAPSPRHVWVEEDWRWRNNNYISTGGYWSAPPRGYAVWVNGYWKQSKRGWVWKPGHWR